MKLEEVQKDWRGITYILREDDKEFAVITTNCDGALRGGHSNSFDAIVFVLEGMIDFVWTDSKPEDSKSERYNTNSTLHIPKDTPHLIVSVGDSVIVLKRLGEYKNTNYPPYRKLIEAKKPMHVEEVMKILKQDD